MKLSRRMWFAGLAAIALSASGYAGDRNSETKSGPEDPKANRRPARQGTKLRNIREIQELRSAFNRAKGHPRLILLFSPT